MKFRVGDVCVIVKSHGGRPVGVECLVLDVFGSQCDPFYDVELNGHERWFVEEDQLRLKKPPSIFLGRESHLTAEDKLEDRQKERV